MGPTGTPPPSLHRTSPGSLHSTQSPWDVGVLSPRTAPNRCLRRNQSGSPAGPEMDRRKFKEDFYKFHQYQHKTEAGQLY